jgi:hypothetical protein
VKTKHTYWHCALIFSGFVALAGSRSPYLYAEDRLAGSASVEAKEAQLFERDEQPRPPAKARHSTRMVGPSAEEIHDFLYPPSVERNISPGAN